MIRVGFLLVVLPASSAFVAITSSNNNVLVHREQTNTGISTPLRMFDKIFEKEGMLGKGITVGKVQVALTSKNRSDRSIFGLLEDHASLDSDSNEDLSRMANDVCLDLMRKEDDWVAACSTGKWFSEKDGGKAESYYNELANNEAAKFEKEYLPDEDDEEVGGPTLVVVSLILEIQGDSTKFDGAGYSISQTREVLASIASDCLIDDGYCVNAVEALWTPSDREEILSKEDISLDFPELIDL